MAYINVHWDEKPEIKGIHEAEVRLARDQDRAEPDWSNTIEMILRKGVKAYESGSIS